MNELKPKRSHTKNNHPNHD